MKVTIRDAGKPRVVLVTLDDKPANLPPWIEIRPDDVRRPLVTDEEPFHHFDRSTAIAGGPKELVATARAYLDGEIYQEAAEAAMHEALIGWSSVSRQ